MAISQRSDQAQATGQYADVNHYNVGNSLLLAAAANDFLALLDH